MRPSVLPLRRAGAVAVAAPSSDSIIIVLSHADWGNLLSIFLVGSANREAVFRLCEKSIISRLDDLSIETET